MLTETFYIVLLTTCSGLIIKIASMAYKSKCSECDCFGFHIKRNVELEEQEHEYDVSHQLNKIKSNTNLEMV